MKDILWLCLQILALLLLAGPVKFPSKQYLCCPKVTFLKEPDTVEPVTLLCIVPIHKKIRQWKNVTYEIEWFVDGKKPKYTEKPYCLPPKGQTKNKNSCPAEIEIRSRLSGLPGLEYYEPGQWITCEVKARFTTSALHPWSDTVSVTTPFFAGIKVTPSTIVIPECKEPFHRELTLTPMIPVRKALSVQFYLPDGLWLLDKDDCSISIKGTTPVKVKVGATCTTLYGLAKLKVITPKITNRDESVFWGDFGLPTVWVNVLQKDTSLHKCKSVTDPHYRMLDKQNVLRERWHDFFGHGDYVLYRNKEKNFEVQTRQWACNNARSITCNCGVVIRDHNDLIRFSCCGDPPKTHRDKTTKIQVDIPRAKCLAPGITLNQLIKGINSKYEVIVPTGIKVVLERNYWGIDVTIYTPRTTNRADEEGLCTYDKHRHGDINTFGNQYRKWPSYFDELPPEVNQNSDGIKYEKACACDETKDKGKTTKCAKDGIPVNWPSFEKDKYNRIKMCDRDPKKREAEGSDELTEEDYELFMKPVETEAHNRLKRSANVVSKDNATRYCAERLAETPVGKLCAKLGTNVQALVNVCSSDIEYTGDLSFAIGAVSMLMDECNDVIIENITVNSNDTSTETTPTIPPIVETITQLLCPNDCTFKGKCVNGSCVCNKNYTAKDCSISIYQKPHIVRLQSNGLCDRRKRACKKVAVQGTGFLNSVNVTCHITETEIVNSSWIPNKNESKYPGIMTDLVLVECFLPESPVLRMQYDENVEGTSAAGLLISVSNNGIHKSKQKLKLISFDSVCMECNVSSGCFLKNNSCFINRYCFAPNEPNPKDWCQPCLPDVETNRWTKRQVNHPPNVTSITDYYVVYGERLELLIEATDPEGMPITISLMEGSPKEALMQNNILLWNVTTKKTTNFFFKATDACQASSTLNITITVNVCPCNNSGVCIPRKPRGRGYYDCNCAPGFTGQYCNTEINECESFPCLRGRCTDQVNNYTCSCDLGFEGRNCDVDIDYCKSSPCVHGNCTDQVNEYTCSCEPGYSGQRCETDIDECNSSPCRNNGTCQDQVNGYKCRCLVGFTGQNCEVDINECQSSPCVNGTCVDKVNGFSCNCQAGFSGLLCEENINECLQASCGNGTCLDQVNNYSCICNVGFTGQHCDVVITHCSNDSCYPGVACTERSNTISCGSCPSGFTGDGKNCKDIDDCVNHTCVNGGSCADGINSYSCNCLAGFTGNYCQINIDDCVNRTCASGGSCVDGVNSYSCSCVAGYTGDHCEKDIDECVNHTCANGGLCIDGVNSYSCNCSEGFTGSSCENNIDECVNHTCANGGLCIDGVNSYSCNCSEGFTGSSCENNIDDCVNHTCANGGSCTDGINSYSCNCRVGFTGNYCQINIDDCVNRTCANGGSCVDGVNSYSCSCVAGYTGDHCEKDIDECVNHTCANGGLCIDGVNSYSCNCSEGFTGSSCENNIDDCVNRTCANGGSCVDGVNSYMCSCVAGYTGDYCEKELSTTEPTATERGEPSASTKEENLTMEPTTEEGGDAERKTDFSFQIRVMEEWDDRLRDKGSEKFKKLASLMREEIWKAYSGNSKLREVEILSMRRGSIVAEFQLIFKTKVTEEEALVELKRETANGKLGSLAVDPSSLKPTPAKQGKEERESNTSLPLIIGVSIAAGVVLIVIIIGLVCSCARSPVSQSNMLVGDGMPAEEAKGEIYELKPTNVDEENFGWIEEKGVCNEAIE